MTLNWNSCIGRCRDELRETTAHLCKGSEHHRHGCFQSARGAGEGRWRGGGRWMLVRWFQFWWTAWLPTPSLGFPLYGMEMMGGEMAFPKGRLFHQRLLKMVCLCGGKALVNINMVRWGAPLKQIPVSAKFSPLLSHLLLFFLFSLFGHLLLFLEHTRHTPASEPLHMLFILPRSFPPSYPYGLLPFLSQAFPQTSYFQWDLP